MALHTPTPWVQDIPNGEYIAKLVDGVYEYIGAIDPARFSGVRRSYEECSANAAFIVRAVNAHDELLAALREFDQLSLVIESAARNEHPVNSSACARIVAAIHAARAAIAKAEG